MASAMSRSPQRKIPLAWAGVVCLLALLVVLTANDQVLALDMNWMQTGVRLWYVGGTGPGGPGLTSNAEEANLIDSVSGGAVTVVHQQALANWTSPLPATNFVNPAPLKEGIFWINPIRLEALRTTQDSIVWLGRLRVVRARQTMTLATVPFLKLLPVMALFQIKPTRDIVTLHDANTDESSGEYYFDVATGLLLSKTERLGADQVTMLSLAEINYDFATARAYPEDNGPHSAYAGWFAGGRQEFLNNQGFQLNPMVLSRYNNLILMSMSGQLANVSSALNYFFDDYLYYDLTKNEAGERPVDQEAWNVNGDHLFWWLPVEHLALPSISVWNMTLYNRGTTLGNTTFSAGGTPSAAGFPSLQFNAQGYLVNMVASAPAMGLYVDTSLSPSRRMEVQGLDYYTGAMKPGIPQANNRPTITRLANLTIPRGGTQVVNFTVRDRETPAGQLRAGAVSSKATVIPQRNLKLGGGGSQRTLTITAGQRLGQTAIGLMALDQQGAVAIRRFVVTVQ